jgi:hypothetical protein
MNLSLGSYPTHSFTSELVFFYHLSALASNVVWLCGYCRLGWGIISFSLGAYGVPGFIPLCPLQKFSSFNFFAYQMEGPRFH